MILLNTRYMYFILTGNKKLNFKHGKFIFCFKVSQNTKYTLFILFSRNSIKYIYKMLYISIMPIIKSYGDFSFSVSICIPKLNKLYQQNAAHTYIVCYHKLLKLCIFCFMLHYFNLEITKMLATKS